MTGFDYVRERYGVPAEIGRAVVVNHRSGVIVADRGNYIGVNFDDESPGIVRNVHPKWEVVYGEMVEIRKPTRASAAWLEYMDADYGHSFAEWLGIEKPRLEYHWDSRNANKYRYVRAEHTRRGRWRQRVEGQYAPTMKEAKASYKEALKKVLADERKWRAEGYE